MPLTGEAKRGSQRGRQRTGRDVLALRAKGKTLEEIGNQYGVTKQRIHQQIKELVEIADKKAVKEFRENLGDILAAAHARVLSYLVKPEVLEKASANNLGYVQTQLHTSRRLEEGQSTVNLALHEIVLESEREAQKRAGAQDVVVERPAEMPSDAKS